MAIDLVNPDEALVDRVHARTLSIDAHIDVRDGFNTPGNDAGGETAGQFDLPKFLRGGLKVAVIALAADAAPDTTEGRKRAREQVAAKYDGIRRLVEAHPDKIAFARSSEEIAAIVASGRQAILLSFLNAVALDGEIAEIARLHEKGVRLLGFSHIGNNSFADSSRPNPAFGDTPFPAGGLTQQGKEALAELNRLGIVPDVSQLSPAGVIQTVELSKTPVIASHSAIRARIDSPRNLSNDELRAIAASGGVVHIVAFAPYIRDRDGSQEAFAREVFEPFGLRQGQDEPREVLSPEDFERFQAGYRKFSGRRLQFASLVDYLDALDYAVRLVGVDHVGIGSDFNNGGGVVGYADVGDARNLTRELLKRGYSEQDVAKLWGGNFLRVLEKAEEYARIAG